jgi:hypothetical protein
MLLAMWRDDVRSILVLVKVAAADTYEGWLYSRKMLAS